MGLEKTRGLNYHLSTLLNGIDEGTVVLPEFQRDFDWNTAQIRQLVATVLLGWPLGSLLLLPGTGDNFFTLRAFQDAPDIQSAELVVLDGQQRLTALYHALHGKGKGRYALRIDLLGEDQSVEDVEECIEWFPDSQWESRFPTPTAQWRSNLLPITALKSPSDFYEWRDEACSDARLEEVRAVTSIYKRSLAGLHQYEIPAAVINADVPGTAVARIFERVNRLGKPLGTFDLVVARSFTKAFNLRDQWADARRQYPMLQAFLGDEGLPVLNVIALRTTGNVRAQAVLDLTGDSVRDNWSQAAEATNNALEFASRHLGVWAPDWFPYKPMLTILAGLSFEFPLDSEVDALKKWFWSTGFSAGFDVASNTRAVAAYKSLKADTGYVSQVTLVKDDLLQSNKKQFGAIHRAFMSFLAARDPLDVDTEDRLVQAAGSGLVPDVGTLSVFPRRPASASSGNQGDDGLHLRTLSNFLVSGPDERKYPWVDISDYPPQTLERQLISSQTAAPEAPEEFLEMRLANLISALETDISLTVKLTDRE